MVYNRAQNREVAIRGSQAGVAPSLLFILLLSSCATTTQQSAYKSYQGEVSPTKQKITELLDKGEKVKIAFYNENGYLDKNILHHLEAEYLTRFGKYNNFSLVERDYLERIMREHKLNLTGAVEDSDIVKLGRISGITHLIFWDKHWEPYWTTISIKLVELETGKILTSSWRSWRN